MTEKGKTAVQVAEEEYLKSREVRIAMQRLLHDLRDWVRVYPLYEGEKLPEEIAVHWVSDADGNGPERLILDAIKQNPGLWADCIPKECCIVPRAELAKLITVPPLVPGCPMDINTVVDYLAQLGAHMANNQALRLKYEAEEKELRERYAR